MLSSSNIRGHSSQIGIQGQEIHPAIKDYEIYVTRY